MIKTYETLCFEDKPQWDKVSQGKIDVFQWESENPYRPETVFKMCFVKNKGVFVKMKTDETNIRSVCSGRDENCWEDSCMEFFFKPFSDADEYMNFEMTAKSAYLSAFGASRDGRVFLKELTDEAPSVHAEIKQDGWSLELFLPCCLIESVYKKEFCACAGEYRANFFKCGDKTETPHFGSFSPMGSLPPGFHNPELFAKIIVKEVSI
ncbi:MAG: carbohydrate-binding family 9-like protein [Acutalibacteraceae bacterium]